MDSCPEEDLVAACRRGDQEGYPGLVKRNINYVFALCYGMLGNIHDTEDVVQEVFIRGFKKINTLHDNARFSQWIRQIARNICIDFLRGHKKEEHLPLDESIGTGRSDTGSCDYLDLQDAIQNLKQDYRLPIVLYYFDGRSPKSIGEALKIDEATVYTRLSRARKELRRLLTVEEGSK